MCGLWWKSNADENVPSWRSNFVFSPSSLFDQITKSYVFATLFGSDANMRYRSAKIIATSGATRSSCVQNLATRGFSFVMPP